MDLCAIGIDTIRDKDDIGAPGDSFLRNAYVVMDLVHNEISIAQVVYTVDSSIVEIPAEGVAAINF